MHGLQAQPPAVDRVRVRGAITSGVDVRVRRSAVIVDHNSIIDIETGLSGKFRIWQYADTNNHEVSRDFLSF